MKQNVSDVEKYTDLLYDFIGVGYSWGHASYLSADCSGTLNLCLNMIYNTNMRYCADDLYKKYFTIRDKASIEDENSIAAVFFIDKKTGKAVHVAGRVKKDWYLNMSSIEENKEAHVRHVSELKGMYPSFTMVLCALDKVKWINDGRRKTVYETHD